MDDSAINTISTTPIAPIEPVLPGIGNNNPDNEDMEFNSLQDHGQSQSQTTEAIFDRPTEMNQDLHSATDGKIRRSTRDIRRPKFDDELVDSASTLKMITPRKRPHNDRVVTTSITETVDESRKKNQQIEVIHHSPVEVEVIQPETKSKKKRERTENKAISETSRTNNKSSSHKLQRQSSGQPLESLNQFEEGSSAPLPHSQNKNTTGSTSENFKKWTPEDDLALIAAVTWISDIKNVYNLMKFSKKYGLIELEERWYELLYDENSSKAAKKRMETLGKEKIKNILSKIPFSNEEDILLRSIPSNTQSPHQALEALLAQNSGVFHHGRNLKVIEEHWRELKYFSLLSDQKHITNEPDDNLLQIERTVDLTSLAENEFNLDTEERKAIRGIVANERESKEWESVVARAITGISLTTQMAADTLAILRGRCIVYDIRKEKALIGRSTAHHQVDINLTLEGPSARISRQQALLRLYENGEYMIHNLGMRPIYVDGETLLRGGKIRLNNNSMIEIALIRLHFLRNENYVKRRNYYPID